MRLIRGSGDSSSAKVPPRYNEIRTVLTRNGFACERSKKHETWIRRDSTGVVEARTSVSHGNKEIKVPKTFKDILRQSKKTEEDFYRALKGRSEKDSENASQGQDDQNRV